MKNKPFKAFLSSALLLPLVLGPITASSAHANDSQVESPKKLERVLKKDARRPLVGIEDLLKSRFSNWGIDPKTPSSININEAWKNFDLKREVVVAVIDTGIDPHHPFLKDNLYVIEGEASQQNYGIDFSKNHGHRNRPIDSHGHGTHVAGIVKSVFPKVKILTLKYYNPNASGQDNLNSTIEALRYAVNQNVDIINYSGGGPEPAKEELKILKEAERKGILVVAAAGNEKSDIDNRSNAYYPASYGLNNIITVAAHDQGLQMLNSSNYGRNSVHLSAPGHRIKSSLPNDRAGYLTGTSQATAFVTGVAALLKSQFPQMTFNQIKEVIVQSAKKEDTLNGRIVSGGRLDATRAHTLASQLNSDSQSRRDIANNRRTPDSEGGQVIFLRSGEPVEKEHVANE